jgi:GT2 family glycosyltransferase
VKAPVSIVIPVHNGSELLCQLLASIGRQTVEPLEVIVVDNGSTDGAPEVACGMGARVIAMGCNAGFAAAVNRGIREARGDGIALVNSDVELDGRWLEVLWGGVGAAGFATGKILQAGSPDTLDGSYDLICRGGCAWRAGAGRSASMMAVAERIRFCSATAVIYRASVFERVGLFAEEFDSYLEDMDFGLRCAAAGVDGWYLPEAVSRHHGSATFGRWSPRVVRLIARNQVFLIARQYPGKLIRRWLWQILVAQSLWGALALRHGCGWAYLRGKVEGVARFSSVRRGSTQWAGLEPVIVESERQIRGLQSQSGFDEYWSWYFRLAGSRATD